MAGAGYKLFNTGDVLTAAQVNTYLMEQTVMVFANAAARTTALSGVVSEGMISYLKDTNAVEVYDGSNWVSSDDPNAIQNTIVDAKGDLITATASDVPARLAVGNNGETLVADSSQTTGLRWAANYGFTAGKNCIINGDFRINQRSFSTSTQSGAFGFDRWAMIRGGSPAATVTYSLQTFSPGSAPVSGYEGINFARMATTTNSANDEYSIIQQRIEDVRTIAGRTVTVSFWAKAASGTPKVGVEFYQGFGSGGSADTSSGGTAVTISTSWARYSVTIAVPSISGKTVGTSSYTELNFWCSAGAALASRGGSIGNQTATIDFWGVQVEQGSVATAFQTATGTLAGELAACQRYYYRQNWQALSNYAVFGIGFANTTGACYIETTFPVNMRVKPTAVDTAAMSAYAFEVGTTYFNTPTTIAIDSNYSSPNNGTLAITKAGSFAVGTYYRMGANNNSGAYIGWSAEL